MTGSTVSGPSPPERLRRAGSLTVALLRATYEGWREDRVARLGAGLAYYGLFASLPLVTLIGALAGLAFSQQDVQEFLEQRLEGMLAGDAEEFAQLATEQLASGEVQAGLGAIGGVSLVIASSVVFIAVQDAFNVIWHVPVGHGITYTIRRYALGFAVVFLIVAVLIASMAVQAVFGLLQAVVDSDLAGFEPLARLCAALTSGALAMAALALVFRVLPQPRVAWRHALTGAAVTSVALVVGTWAIGWYLSRFGSTSLTGAAGAVALLLVWIYYEAQILLAGAEFTKILTQRTGPVEVG